MWRIIFVEPNNKILQNSDGEFTLGVTLPELKIICIANDVQGKLLCKVLVHELTHASISNKGWKFPLYTEEYIANEIANCKCGDM